MSLLRDPLRPILAMLLAVPLPAQCPGIGSFASTGNVPTNLLPAGTAAEISGMAASRHNPGVLWVHDDGAGAFAYLCARLALDMSGVPEEIGWAFGATPSLLLILPFFARYCGRRGMTFGRFAGALVLMAFLQRLPLIAFGYFATTQKLGTHLDTHVVSEINLKPFGERKFDGGVESWLYPTLIPHLTIWIIVTLVAGLVLGALPFLIARRRAQRAPA